MKLCLLPLLAVTTCVSWAQLTVDQKVLDFEQTAGLFVKGYGPYQWKNQIYGVDLLDASKWLPRIRATTDDLQFYQVMSEWVAQLDDAHAVYQTPSNFAARLNFSLDIYDGKLLVDAINRTRLPAAEYPFVIGYELVSIDGEEATKILDRMVPYARSANERSTRRTAATLITNRVQWIIPTSPSVPDASSVVFRRFDGGLETYRLPWTKTGVPLTSPGKFPAPRTTQLSMEGGDTNEVSPPPETPDYMKVLERLQNCRISDRAVLNFGSVTPIFAGAMPPGFLQRLGRVPTDFFYSGTFQAGGFQIGFIRIPSYSPSDFNAALTQFAREITFFQQNTDGLIVDEMRNPGGSVGYSNSLMSLLFHYPWTSVGFRVRATSSWVASISSAYESAKTQGAPREVIDQLDAIKQKMIEANRANRALTDPIPLDGTTIERDSVRDEAGNLISFSKPMMVLIDEFSASGGDYFAATMQDNGRAILLGWRTMGAGGNVTGWDAGTYSQGFVTMTESLMSRKYERIEAGGLPVSRYVENVGVYPEIFVDYMTGENLIRRGQPFVERFVAAMVEHLEKNR